MAAALLVLDEIEEKRIAPDLKRDMWCAWVELIAQALRRLGKKTTASSLNKAKLSPFVNAIFFLQRRLPAGCRGPTTYELMAKSIQSARKKMNNFRKEELFAVIEIWGAGKMANYKREEVPLSLEKFRSGRERSRQQKAFRKFVTDYLRKQESIFNSGNFSSSRPPLRRKNIEKKGH